MATWSNVVVAPCYVKHVLVGITSATTAEGLQKKLASMLVAVVAVLSVAVAVAVALALALAVALAVAVAVAVELQPEQHYHSI